MSQESEHQGNGAMLKELSIDEHTSVRPLVVSDSERIFEILESDADIRDHVGLFEDCDTLEKLIDKLNDQIAHGALRYAITQDDKLVGYIGIWQDPDVKDVDQYNISDFLASEYRGNGIMGKSLEVLLTEAEKTLSIDKFSAWVEEGNPASAKVLERLGFAHTNIPYKDSKGRVNWDYVREANHE